MRGYLEDALLNLGLHKRVCKGERGGASGQICARSNDSAYDKGGMVDTGGQRSLTGILHTSHKTPRVYKRQWYQNKSIKLVVLIYVCPLKRLMNLSGLSVTCCIANPKRMRHCSGN